MLKRISFLESATLIKSTKLLILLVGKGDEPEVATRVLQFIYVSDSGFRIPVAQFPSTRLHFKQFILLFLGWGHGNVGDEFE